MKAKPLVLDLGARKVRVEFAELHEKLGLALLKDRRILIDPHQNGQEITSTLLHEILHHIDDIYFGGKLFPSETEDPDHPKLDTLANILDMVLTKNAKVLWAMYKVKL